LTNIIAAKGISDVVRTSLGPRGMDKMVSAILTVDLRFKKESFDYQ
jgi:chaperonin GroEL (HSP60 family)